VLPAALVFDFDGLILDTESVEIGAIRRVCADLGHDLPTAAFVAAIGTTAAPDWFTLLERALGRPLDRHRLDAVRRGHHGELMAVEPVRAGVVELLAEAASAGVPCAVASNSPSVWVEGHLERLGLRASFRTVVGVDQVSAGKPAPEPYLAAVAAVGAPAMASVAFEDSSTGVASARAAGLFTVAVPGPMTAGHDLGAADEVRGSLAGLTLDDLAARLAGRLAARPDRRLAR
jgi:HAD superfamily hydrolase (TIGR01509 family)